MIFARFKAILVACMTLGAAVVTTPSPSNAAPVSTGWQYAAQSGQAFNSELTSNVQWRRRRYYRRVYYRPRYYRPRYYRPRVYRRVYVRPRYYRPRYYRRPVLFF